MNEPHDNPEIAAKQMQADNIGRHDRSPLPETNQLQARILKLTNGSPQQLSGTAIAHRLNPAPIAARIVANLHHLARPAVGAAALAIIVMTSVGVYLSGVLLDNFPQSTNVEFSKTIDLERGELITVSSREMDNRAEIDELEWQDILLMQDEIAFAAL